VIARRLFTGVTRGDGIGCVFTVSLRGRGVSRGDGIGRAVAGRRRGRGFTLIEVLLATVLLAAGLALAFATLRAATASAQRGEEIAGHSERVRAVELFLRRRIGGTRPLAFAHDEATGAPILFIGEETRMRFVADLPDYLGRGGPYLHDLQLVDGDGGPELRVGFALVMAGETFEEQPPREPELLAGNLASARFRYRTLGEDGRLGEWQERWETPAQLPLQVQVVLEDRAGRPWPPLVVALPLAGSYAGGMP
jgi:general secretion pathway protein J